MSERSWLLPSAILTILSGAFALLIMPNHSGVLPALGLLPLWLFASASLASITAVVRMMLAGVASPFAHIAHTVRHDWREADLTPAVGALCAFAEKVTLTPSAVERADVDALRDQGWTDLAVSDAVQVIGYFNYITRVADAIGIEDEPEWI